jgi:tellurite resistance protein
LEVGVFLHLLTSEEQVVFCQLALVLVAADGVTHAKEAAFLRRVHQHMDLDELPPCPEGEVVVPAGLFASGASRRALLVELALLAAADGRICDNERALIETFGAQFEVGGQALRQIVSYADRLTAVVDEGDVLVAGG